MWVLKAVPAGQGITARGFSPRGWGVDPLEGRNLYGVHHRAEHVSWRICPGLVF